MEKRDLFTKILAITGTVLAWSPLLLPFVFTTLRFTRRGGGFRIDYLMPAELFPLALLGGGLLLWSAWRARSRLQSISRSFVAAVAMLAGSQLFAVVSGLASGETEPAGWQMGVVLTLIAMYILALIALAFSGLQLLRHLFEQS